MMPTDRTPNSDKNWTENSSIHLPNAVIIGAPKSGTTSLYFYLRQHPDIFLPKKKELHYFSYDLLAKNTAGPGDKNALSTLCDTWRAYVQHYTNVNHQSIVAEVSPSYLYFSETSERIREKLGRVRIVALLRNPAERAFSQYMHLKRANRERLSFFEALQVEEQRRLAGWGDMWRYAESSLYATRIKRYIEVFGEHNVKILLSEEFFSHPIRVSQDLFAFFDVDSAFVPDVSRAYNRTGTPRFGFLADALVKRNLLRILARRLIPERPRRSLRSFLIDVNKGDKGEIDSESRTYLQSVFREDILELERILGRKTHWLEYND
jgi:hypothetical protein